MYVQSATELPDSVWSNKQGEGRMWGLSVLIANLENIVGNYEHGWGFK